MNVTEQPAAPVSDSEKSLKPAQYRRVVAAREAASILRGQNVLARSAVDPIDVTTLAEFILEG